MQVVSTRDNKFSFHNVVRDVRDILNGFYAIVTEASDTSRLNELDELETNYLNRSFGKWIVNKTNLD